MHHIDRNGGFNNGKSTHLVQRENNTDSEFVEKLNKEIMALRSEIEEKEKELGLM